MQLLRGDADEPDARIGGIQRSALTAIQLEDAPGLPALNGADFPAADDVIHPRLIGAPALARAKRQFVDQLHFEHVTQVPRRWALVELRVAVRGEAGEVHAAIGEIVGERLGPSVVAAEHQSPLRALPQFELQAVVGGMSGVGHQERATGGRCGRTESMRVRHPEVHRIAGGERQTRCAWRSG